MPYISYYDSGVKRYFQLLEDRMIIFGREDHTDFQILKDVRISREHFGIEKITVSDEGILLGVVLLGDEYKVEKGQIPKQVRDDKD